MNRSQVLRMSHVVRAFDTRCTIGVVCAVLSCSAPAQTQDRRVAGRRRDRDGQHARARHLAALRDPSRRSEGEILRAVVRALEHHAAIAVRGAAARERQADCRHPGHPARLQHRRDGERRSQSTGHADGRARAFRRAARGLGRQGASFHPAAPPTTAATRRATSSRPRTRRCASSASTRCRPSSPARCCSTPRPISAAATPCSPGSW